MKQLIAVIFTVVSLAICLPSLPSIVAFSDGYIDRNILCRWIAAADDDRLMPDAVARDESTCPGSISASSHYQYGKNCVSKCEPMAIADRIVAGAKETAEEIRERLKLIFAPPLNR